MKRVVLDTNVLVSALIFKGRLAGLVTCWKNGGIVPVISRETFMELKTVLNYPKFALTADEIQTIIEDEILPFFEVVDIKKSINGVCRDPYDDMFLSVAVNARAAWIVTGDKDLLELGKYGAVHIVTPQDFMKRLDSPLKEGFGAWKDKDHPELAEGTEKFVRKTRKSSRLAGDE
jgi:putative PIN family toxin of toxin-antitoxin system